MSNESPAGGAAAKTHINNWESARNKIARQITKAPWFVRNKQIQKELKLTPIPDYFKKLAISFFHKLDSSANTAIAEIPKYDPLEPKKKRRPRTLLINA
ncbi:hypothetical protein AVEN_132433-1 [Araneus ventricosus]|uniref:Uncharacterized protein n=1 Tax=Araneus ventricosus TaxID=182803 RepID=A0A4Y2IGQ3_ARAVE|nr:hypothetical protein AVEN_132433-1 [Araneus ventricosus]